MRKTIGFNLSYQTVPNTEGYDSKEINEWVRNSGFKLDFQSEIVLYFFKERHTCGGLVIHSLNMVVYNAEYPAKNTMV